MGKDFSPAMGSEGAQGVGMGDMPLVSTQFIVIPSQNKEQAYTGKKRHMGDTRREKQVQNHVI